MMFRALIFLFVISFFFIMVQVDLVVLAFAKIGIPPRYVFTALYATLVGSMINIPVKKIPQQAMTTERRITHFGITYRIPVVRQNVTVLAVNVGGAIIPVLISCYLLFATGLYVRSLIAASLLTLVTYRLAKPLPGVGITLPFFLPPLVAAVIAVILSYDHAPIIAYVSGTLGTLVGADILHLKDIKGLGAPIASIGGAGTFDGIFLNGILAVSLSAFLT